MVWTRFSWTPRELTLVEVKGNRVKKRRFGEHDSLLLISNRPANRANSMGSLPVPSSASPNPDSALKNVIVIEDNSGEEDLEEGRTTMTMIAELFTLTIELLIWNWSPYSISHLASSYEILIHCLCWLTSGTQGKEPRAVARHEGRHLGVYGLARQHLFPATELHERRFLLLFLLLRRRRLGMQGWHEIWSEILNYERAFPWQSCVDPASLLYLLAAGRDLFHAILASRR